MAGIADLIVSRVRQAVGPAAAGQSVLLHQPTFPPNAWEYVKRCVDTGWVSSAGSFVNEFERHLSRITGAPHVVAVVNGTAALHMALMLAGVEQGAEVLMPSLTFVATANAAAHGGAVPHFCEVNEQTLGLDGARLSDHLSRCAERRDGGCYNVQTGRRIAAVVPMHTFGHPVAIEPLLELSEQWDIPIVEDAAESLGSLHRGRHTGTFGRLGVLSFNGNKIVTTGAGGAILTHSKALGDRARHLTTTAKLPHPWEYVHDEVGYNYRMPNLNAALGCAQLEDLESLVRRKRELADQYVMAFQDVPGVRVFSEPPGARSNYWLNTLLLSPEAGAERDAVLGALNAAELQSRPAWRPMHRLPMYQAAPRMDLRLTDDLARRIINVPSSAGLVADKPAKRVVAAV